MIYHEMFGQHLRLGNFLFKFAWSVAMKCKFKKDTIYPSYYLWKYLLNQPLMYKDLSEVWVDNYITHDHARTWSPKNEKIVDDIINQPGSTSVQLNTFFQSENWFKDYRRQVHEALQFDYAFKTSVYKKYIKFFDKPTIGIGIRLGDFVGHGDFAQIKEQWYIDALYHHFPDWRENYNVIVFSDDIDAAKNVFCKYSEFQYADPNGTHTHADNFKHYHGDASEHLILGSMMDHWIIGNSTFSWWQAWLATYNKKNSKVIHSGEVFSKTGNMKHIDTSDYYCKNWIKS